MNNNEADVTTPSGGGEHHPHYQPNTNRIYSKDRSGSQQPKQKF